MPPSPSKFQGNPSGRGGSSAVDVSDADGKFCYSVPKRHISHYGVDGGGGRLVACRNYTAAIEQQKGGDASATGDRSASAQSTNSNSHSSHSNNSRGSHHTPNTNNCPMGHRCKFVHIDIPLSSMRSEPIHTHFVWKGPEQVSYEMLPPVIAKEQPQLSEKEISETLLTVFGPNNREPSEKLRADQVLMTRGARFAYEAAIGCPRSDDAPPCCHCAHYYFNQVCNRGPNCAFVHVISCNPTLSESHIKTSNFHRRISLLGEENLYSNGTDPVAPGGHQSAPVSRQPSLQRSGSAKEDSAILSQQNNNNNKNQKGQGANANVANGRGRAASFPLASVEGHRNIAAELEVTLQQRNNQHQRNPSLGSMMLNPSVNSTPRVHIHVPTPPPVALGSTPKDSIQEELRNSNNRHTPHNSLRQNHNGTPPPPPPAQSARGGSGGSNNIGGGAGRGVSIGASAGNNTSNNSFISFNNAPMLATANTSPAASRRVSIGPFPQDLSHPGDNAQNPTPTKFAAGNQSTNSYVSANGNNKRAAESTPPPPPAQALIRQPSHHGSFAQQPQQPQQHAPQPQQQTGAEEIERQHSHVSYDDGFNANYQDYMSNGNQASNNNYSNNGNGNGNAPHYSAPYGQFYGDHQQQQQQHYNQNNAEYSQGGPGYYQPSQQQFQPPHVPQYYQQQPPLPPHPQQQQQLRSPPNQRLQSPNDFHPKGPGLPPPPSYETSFGHLSLSSRPTSPHPPQYNASWSTAAGGASGSVNNRPPQMPQSPPYPGSSQQASFPPRPHSNNIASIYQSNVPSSQAYPALPSPVSNPSVHNTDNQPPSVRVGGMTANPLALSSSKRSDDYSSPEGLALGKNNNNKAAEVGMGQRQNSAAGVIVGNNSSPNRLGGGDKNGDSMTSPPLHNTIGSSATATPTSSLDVTKASRYVHNPYSAGNGGAANSSVTTRSRTTSMTGPTPQMLGAILSSSQLPPPQVCVADNQVW